MNFDQELAERVRNAQGIPTHSNYNRCIENPERVIPHNKPATDSLMIQTFLNKLKQPNDV